MPTYEYRCEYCGRQFEEFQSIKAAPLKKCPSCGKAKLERLIGTGAAILFKGSGFYETDYRSESYKKAADADKPASETKSDAKPDAKPESKPDAKPEIKAEAKKPEPKAEAAKVGASTARVRSKSSVAAKPTAKARKKR